MVLFPALKYALHSFVDHIRILEDNAGLVRDVCELLVPLDFLAGVSDSFCEARHKRPFAPFECCSEIEKANNSSDSLRELIQADTWRKPTKGDKTQASYRGMFVSLSVSARRV